jgi:hypothetical protein
MLLAFLVILLTANQTFASKVDLPPCPDQSQRVFYPSAEQPLWAACQDKAGRFQGLLVRYSNQNQIIRIAHLKNSLRHGKEIRAGAPGTYEERHYVDGHLQASSFLFKSPAQLYQLLPTPMTKQDWDAFKQPSDQSLFTAWTRIEPYSVITFESGRLVRLQATRNNEDPKTGKITVSKTDYRFKVSPDGRMMAQNHPEMKDLFFTDPEALWVLNASDLKAALTPGFGSCKKYAGPIGRFGRHYDHLLFRRESSETTHVEKMKEIRDRFFNFCVPEDIRENIGTLECPPQMPTLRLPTLCFLPLSDQAKLPYHPRFFKFEFTRNKTPGEFQKLFLDHGLTEFVSDFSKETDVLDLGGAGKNTDKVTVRKTPRGIRWRPYKVSTKTVEQDKDWWEWHGIPGY